MPFRYLGPPPPQRENWQRLNSSQKRYAIEQHNKARARRNLPPYVLGEPPVDPEPPLQPDDSTSETGSHTIRVGSDNQRDWDPEYSDSDLDWSYSGSNNGDNSASCSGDGQADIPMAGVDSTSNVGGTSHVSKKRKTELPGTGNENADDADTGFPSLENAVIHRPFSNTTGNTFTFSKHHTLVSYGIANLQLKLGSFADERIGSTSLMYLPVDRPWFYVSPSEWFSVISKIRGVRVKELKCKVTMRNPRTAFETNSSESQLATLNQNKFALIGKGLSNVTRGVNCYMTFQAKNVMKPETATNIDTNKQCKIISAIYGVDENDLSNILWADGATLPCTYMDLPMMMPIYFCHYANKKRNEGGLGWQNIQRHIEKVDASSLIGRTIIDYSYKPKHGLLTCPWSHVWAGRHAQGAESTSEENIYMYEMGARKLANDYMLNINTGVRTDIDRDVQALTEAKWKNYFTSDKDRYLSVIECGQYIQQGIGTYEQCGLQPSIHVGIAPVPQLTTTNATLVPEKFTDIECTWDIDVQMVCEYGIPYHYTHFKFPHTELEHSYMAMENVHASVINLESTSSFQNKHLGIQKK